MPFQTQPKEEKTKYYLRIRGWSNDPPTHFDPVWHTILDTLVHRHCYYTIQSNTSIDDIGRSDYEGVLTDARITEMFYWMYPKREETTHVGLQIFGKVGNLEQRRLKRCPVRRP